MKLDKKLAIKKLAKTGLPFLAMFEHGTLTVEIYKPDGVDLQQPHTRDEIYVIISGSGEFMNAGKRSNFSPGDLFFVAAGAEHRFENFSHDFSTWVIFYGPEGGENAF